MEVLTQGHKYQLTNFEDKNSFQVIQFIEKTPTAEGSTELKTVNDGTTNEELLEVLLDRLNFLQAKFPCRENALAITNAEQALMWLNRRTQNRVRRGVEGTNQK